MAFFYVLAAVAATISALVLGITALRVWERVRRPRVSALRTLLLFAVPALASVPCADCYDKWPVGPRSGRAAVASAALFALVMMLVGCGGTSVQWMGGSPTTTTSADPCATCVAPQICAVGCGESPGCFTPGGTLDAGPNDCPSCFPMFDQNAAACSHMSEPWAFYCQSDMQLGGCTPSAKPGYFCCPPGVDGGAP